MRVFDSINHALHKFMELMKNSGNIRFLLLIILAGILRLTVGCYPFSNENFQVKIDSIAARLVPNECEGICNVSAEIGKKGIIILRGETSISETRNEIIKALSKPGIELIDSIVFLPDTIKNTEYRGVVNLSVINMRKHPDHRSELVSQAILGTPVMILKNEKSWLLIQTPDKYLGWTEKSSVQMMGRTEMEAWRKAARIIYLDNNGWVYTSPDENSIVGDLVAGSILESTGESQDYIKVIFPDKREGFVRKKPVMDFNLWRSQSICTEDNVCRIATTFLGLPYLWGGTTSKAADCSGFVQSVYFLNGRVLPRDASLQADHGIDVDLSQGYYRLERGDLLFFGSKENSINNVTHVAIYLGDSEYIHSSGRVMINSLDSTKSNYSSSRRNSLLIARRIIGVENDTGIIHLYKHH